MWLVGITTRLLPLFSALCINDNMPLDMEYNIAMLIGYNNRRTRPKYINSQKYIQSIADFLRGKTDVASSIDIIVERGYNRYYSRCCCCFWKISSSFEI